MPSLSQHDRPIKNVRAAALVVEKGVNKKKTQFVMIVGRWLIYGRMSSFNQFSSDVVPLKTFSQSTNFIDASPQACHYLHHTNISTHAGTDSTG